MRSNGSPKPPNERGDDGHGALVHGGGMIAHIFEDLCDGCNDCVAVCPTHVLDAGDVVPIVAGWTSARPATCANLTALPTRSTSGPISTRSK
ncbi:ATP-binding protein [Novosphingobium sp. BL-52-GroH]|uniref:ATP-binding protein n=1 Tax=Novosphingobium sp. BL-52-GroH TaxID=3349877 RepID=UPI003850B39B